MNDFPWNTDRTLSNQTARELIESQFPRLSPVRVTGRAQGWDNEAIEINGAWIFRFPKRADAALDLERELQLLPHLTGCLPLAIPRYEFFGSATRQFPYLFAGYRKLSGVPATHLAINGTNIIATQLGAFLLSLHTVDWSKFDDMDIHSEQDTPDGYWPDVEADLASLAAHLRAPTSESCREFLRRQESGFVLPATRVLLHADLGDEHILLATDGSSAIGIIDWTDAACGDAAHDFAGIWAWQGEVFARRVAASYALAIDERFWARTRFYGLCATITTLDYAFKIGDKRLIKTQLRALERPLN